MVVVLCLSFAPEVIVCNGMFLCSCKYSFRNLHWCILCEASCWMNDLNFAYFLLVPFK